MAITDLSYLYPIFPVIGSIAVFFCLLPVPLHWGAGNIAIVSLSLWTGIGLLIFVINSCIWHGNIRNPYPIWGDIAQVYNVMLCGGSMSSCMFYIQYQVWNIARLKAVFITKRQKRRQTYLAFFFCLGVPLILTVAHYVVQGHRYNLIEDIGPWFTTYNVTLAFPLYYMWDPLFCLAAGMLAIHTMVLISNQRRELDIALDSGATQINRNRYMRLFSIAMLATCINLPIALWPIIYNAIDMPVYPWVSWEVTQSNYHRIEYITRFMLSITPRRADSIFAALWSLVAYNFCIFFFFGLGDDAMIQYRSWFRVCLKPFGVELLKQEKKTVNKEKRTWLDVLLRRPIRPIFADSFPRNRQHPQSTFDVVHTQTSVGDSHIVESHIHGDGTGTRMSDKDSAPTVPIEEKPSFNGKTSAEMLDNHLATPNVEDDIEAQTVSALEIEAGRRKEILERDPELTEEISF